MSTAHAQRIVVLEKCFAVGIGGIVSRDVRSAVRNRPQPVLTVVAGLGGRAITRASLHRLFNDAIAERLELLTFLDLDLQHREPGAGSRTRPNAAPARWPKAFCATSAPCRPVSVETTMEQTTVKFYQTGTFTVGNRLLEPDQRSVQASVERSNSLNSGHRACQGCGEALGARYAIDTAMAATGGQLIAANATGCLEVFSTPYPETSWQIPGSTPCSEILQLWPLASPRRCGSRDAARCVSWPREATVARPTSVSAACRACSSATTMCSTSVMTTRPT